MSQALQKQNLWLSVVAGDIKSISSPRRLTNFVGIDSITKMVVINQLLLTPGVFVGRSPMCPLRIQSDQDAPVFGLRFDMLNRWTIYGLGADVRIGSKLVPPTGAVLHDEDVVTYGPYRFKVLSQLSDEEISELSTELDSLLPQNDTKEISQDPFVETDFELRMGSN